MKRIDVVKKQDGWAGESGGRTVRNTKAPTKAEAVKKVASAARKDPQPVSVGSTRRTARSKRNAPTPDLPTRAGARGRPGPRSFRASASPQSDCRLGDMRSGCLQEKMGAAGD